MMDLVFAVWCVIFSRKAKKTGPVRRVLISKGRNTVNFRLCYELYLYYMDKKRYDQYNGSSEKDRSTDSILRDLERTYNAYRF